MTNTEQWSCVAVRTNVGVEMAGFANVRRPLSCQVIIVISNHNQNNNHIIAISGAVASVVGTSRGKMRLSIV